MGEIIDNLIALFIYPYVGSVLLMTYIVLKHITKNPKGWVKSLIVFIIGIGLGYIWVTYIDGTELDKLIYSFFFANAFYSLLLKRILNAVDDKYNNNKGLL